VCRRPILVADNLELTIVFVGLALPDDLASRLIAGTVNAFDKEASKERAEIRLATSEGHLRQARRVQEELDAGLDPDVIRMFTDSAGLASLSERKRAEMRDLWDLLLTLAKAGDLPNDLKKRVISAATAGFLPGGAAPADTPKLAYRPLGVTEPTEPRLVEVDESTGRSTDHGEPEENSPGTGADEEPPITDGP